MMCRRYGTGLLLLIAMLLSAGARGDEMVRFAPTSYANMYEYYTDAKEHSRPVLLTSDSVLHTTHVLFDYTLRAAELRAFDQRLRELTNGMQLRMTDLAQQEAGRRYLIAPPPYGYDRVAAYFGVGQKLLNPDAVIPEIIRPLVEQEVALILAHQGPAISPIMGVTEDYSQYVPRGHYTRNEGFARYFRAMLWFGRAGFPISGEKAPFVPLTQEEARANAWAGMMLARNLDRSPLYRRPDSPTYLGLWESIYQPTQFIVGNSDDLTPPEYAALSRKVFGDDLPGAWLPDVQAKTDQFIAEAIKLRPPQILGTVQSDREKTPPVAVRLFGQRFTPDSAIFQRLVEPQVPGRTMPSGLDVMAALGSPLAVEQLRARGEFTRYPGYAGQLNALQAEINRCDDLAWRRTAYMLWLQSIRRLVADPSLTGTYPEGHIGHAYPDWWRSPAWQAKQLNAGLGSWAELRHDTILYVKQSYTALRSSMLPPVRQEPLVYVEPVPQVYGGIISLLSTMREELTAQGVFPQEMAANYDEFTRLLRSLVLISTQETLTPEERRVVRMELPTIDDLERVGNVGSILKGVETLPPDLRAALTGDKDARVALIADVHTDPNSGNVLEVGVGNVMSVTVPMTVDGETEEISGPIFSYYEFPHPMAQRLTDAAWQQMLRTGQAGAPFMLGSYLPTRGQ